MEFGEHNTVRSPQDLLVLALVLGALIATSYGLWDRARETPASAPAKAHWTPDEELALASATDTAKLRSIIEGTPKPTRRAPAKKPAPFQPAVALGVLPETDGPQIAAPDGPLADDVAERIVNANLGAAIDCARRLRKEAGRLEMALTIEPNGRVAKVAVHATTLEKGGKKVASCVSERMRAWAFPSFSGPATTVLVPFVFE